ncbi:hypothetical protein AVEN_60523-1 [Araneus ventricosus]|uniref:Uncharacterized protein n=1 Tax=Araneus ventricosus TaxID=182803 RepID=A0A4Y2FQF4_ARAVE|nr:hypothetical protein AVEN_60523-1 [Araneus ventricosus]
MATGISGESNNNNIPYYHKTSEAAKRRASRKRTGVEVPSAVPLPEYRPRWPNGRYRLGSGNPVPLKIRRVWGLLHAKSYASGQTLSGGVAWRDLERGASSGVVLVIDHRSKLRGPPNSPSMASRTGHLIYNLLPSAIFCWDS